MGLICPNNNNVTKKKLQEERTKEMLKKIKSWKTKIMKYIKGNETEEIFFVETRFEKDRIVRCRMKCGEVISMPVGGIKIQKTAE